LIIEVSKLKGVAVEPSSNKDKDCALCDAIRERKRA